MGIAVIGIVIVTGIICLCVYFAKKTDSNEEEAENSTQGNEESEQGSGGALNFCIVLGFALMVLGAVVGLVMLAAEAPVVASVSVLAGGVTCGAVIYGIGKVQQHARSAERKLADMLWYVARLSEAADMQNTCKQEAENK